MKISTTKLECERELLLHMQPRPGTRSGHRWPFGCAGKRLEHELLNHGPAFIHFLTSFSPGSKATSVTLNLSFNILRRRASHVLPFRSETLPAYFRGAGESPKHFAIMAGGYLAPLLPPTLSTAFRNACSSSGVSFTSIALAFSSRYLTRLVPGIGRKSSLQ